MADGDAVALTILTGFLGAGKTTLVNRLLKDPALAGTAIVVNEFGEIALDHLLMQEAAAGDIIEIGDGCLCCTVRGVLADTLVELAARTPRLARVVVETTGLADPVPVLQAVMAHPELSRDYRIESVVTVVDAFNGAATLDGHEEARSQAALADVLVVSKADLAPAPDVERLVGRLSALNPHARIVDAREADAGSAALLSSGASAPRLPPHGHHHHAHNGHVHGDGGYGSVALRHPHPLPLSAVENFLDLVATQEGERILRIKGLVETPEDPEAPILVQGAQRLLHRPERLAGWPDGERGTRIVVIGRGLDVDYIRRVFAAFAGHVAVDTPDRAALLANPLAVPGFNP